MADLESLLPDFEDMNSVAVAASNARLQAQLVKDKLDTYIANCVRLACQNSQFWVNNKPPTQTYIDRVVAIMGNTPEDAAAIKAMHVEYLELQKQAEEARTLLMNMRDQLAAFQTLSSNKRAGVI